MDGAFRWGGRYNEPGEFGTLYLSKTKKGCAAEVTRRPAHPTKYVVGKIKVTLGKVCDLTDPELLKKPKLTKEQLTVDDWNETQALGELIREAGFVIWNGRSFSCRRFQQPGYFCGPAGRHVKSRA